MSLMGLIALVSMLVAVSVTDVRERVIPNRLLLGAVTAWAAGAVTFGQTGAVEHIAAAVLISLPLLVAALLKPEGMGMGDVKLVAVIGLFLGWQAWPALLVGLALAGMTGVMVSLGRRQAPSETSLPLAPFLAAGTVPVLLLTAFPLQ
jgi:leader peptidase (prepilin peptidase)/N-methyltransferase